MRVLHKHVHNVPTEEFNHVTPDTV